MESLPKYFLFWNITLLWTAIFITHGHTNDVDSTSLSAIDYQKQSAILTKLSSVESAIQTINSRLQQLETQCQKNNTSALKNLELKIDQLEARSKVAPIPENCQQVKAQGHNVSGIFLVKPKYASDPFLVSCDMTTRDGGWTVFLNRFDGSVDFYVNWDSYQHGFGNLAGEFWLGLEKIYQLCGYQVNELLVEVAGSDNKAAFAHYNQFGIGSSLEGYHLKTVNGFSGSASNPLVYHAGAKFTTKDRDQDSLPKANAAVTYKGAWWHRDGHYGQLTGLYKTANQYQSPRWGERYNLKKARMMIRPQSDNTLL
ncbi:microfibril-associated glycoprotein 4-like [Zophobas morio]|uniref:microfibril-associated glycoprotein 4-like n=1 Tax=Zophobas morio TaxID=2755281 RepID=UPI0030839D0E